MQNWYVLEIRKVAVEKSALYIAMFEDFHLTSGTKMRLSYIQNSSVCSNCLTFILTKTAAQSRALAGSLQSGAVKGNTNVDIIVDMQL